jgi:TonB family protein
MISTKWVLGVILVAICPFAFAQSGGNGFIEDKDNNVVAFEDTQYPPLALNARIQGTVIVEVQFDNQGAVSRTHPISGTAQLISTSIENAKKWVFKPNASKKAIIVYKYKILEGRCNHNSSLFILQGANVATVLACPPQVNP